MKYALLLLCLCLDLPAAQAQKADRRTTFFVGRLRFSQNDGDDCGTVAQELGNLLRRASSIEVQNEKKIRLADDSLYETPFLFMNGHNDFVLSDAEV